MRAGSGEEFGLATADGRTFLSIFVSLSALDPKAGKSYGRIDTSCGSAMRGGRGGSEAEGAAQGSGRPRSGTWFVPPSVCDTSGLLVVGGSIELSFEMQ